MAVKGNIPDIGKAYILKVGKDLEAETENRIAADNALGKKLDKEIADRKEQGSELSGKLDEEAKARKDADDELRRAIEAEQKARELGDSVLRDDLGDLSDRVDTVEGNVTNIDSRVTNIENNMAGGVTVDATLTKEGEAADAKAVGDRLSGLESGLREAQSTANEASQKANMALSENDAQDEEIDGLKSRVAALENGGSGGGSGVAVDATLTKEGQAADAKVVGDRLKGLSDKAQAAQNTADEAAAAASKIEKIQKSTFRASMLPAPWFSGEDGMQNVRVAFIDEAITFFTPRYDLDSAYLYYFNTNEAVDSIGLKKVPFNTNVAKLMGKSVMISHGISDVYSVQFHHLLSEDAPIGLYWDYNECKFCAYHLTDILDSDDFASKALLHVWVPNCQGGYRKKLTMGLWDLMYAQNPVE